MDSEITKTLGMPLLMFFLQIVSEGKESIRICLKVQLIFVHFKIHSLI